MKTLFCFLLISINSLYLTAQIIADKPGIKQIMDRVNQYQYERPHRPEIEDVNRPVGNWTRAVYYHGVMAGYKATRDKRYLEQCDNYGNLLNWQVAFIPADHRFSGCNVLTAPQIWLESYMLNKQTNKITPLIQHLDNPEAKNPLSTPLEWGFELGRNLCDVLYTGPPALAMLFQITGDDKYLWWMDSFFWEIYGELYDREAHLFYRDSRFFPECLEQRANDPEWNGNHQVTANGKKVLWSRGNGWVFAALVRILQYLPKDYPNYSRYVLLYKDMAKSLKDRQSDEGFWHPNLDDPDDVTVMESSGTGFFTYGFAYGINEGILDKQEYLPVVEKAWKFLYSVVNDEGRVQWGQIVGDRPVMLKKEDSHEFVNGIFLLAASEVYKIK